MNRWPPQTLVPKSIIGMDVEVVGYLTRSLIPFL